ncbi:MAG: CHAT domain-containing tetratricopeptide repeat protein [Pseudomonadota bacterium]
MKRISITVMVAALMALSCTGAAYAQSRDRPGVLLKEARDLQLGAKSQADLEAALRKSREALGMFQRNQGHRGALMALLQMAVIFDKMGRHQRSMECYDRVLEIARSSGNMAMEARALNSLSAVFNRFGRHKQAVDSAQRSADLFRRLGDDGGLFSALNRQGKGLTKLGRYHEAMESYRAALEIGRKLGDGRREANLMRNMAEVYVAQGDFHDALDTFERALTISRTKGLHDPEGEILIGIGQTYSQMEQYDKAGECYRKGIDVMKAAGRPALMPKHLLAEAYLDMGDLEKAEPLVRESGSTASAARYGLLKNDLEQAESLYGTLLANAEKTGNINALFSAYTGLGMVCEHREDYERAEDHYTKGMNLVEEIRSAMLPEERRNFFQVRIGGFSRLEPARGLTRVRMKQNHAAESIESSEAVRARAFTDAVATRARENSNVPHEIIEKENELVGRLASLKQERQETSNESDPEEHGRDSQEIEKADKDLKGFTNMLWAQHSAYAAIKYPKPVALKDSALRPEEHVVIFDVLGEGVGVKLIKGKKIAQTFFLRWNVQELEKDIREFRRSFERVALGEFDASLGHALYKRLLSAVLMDVPKGTPIIIIPDGALALLPFECLVTDGRATWNEGQFGAFPSGLTYVGDVNPVSYYQSVTALTLARSSESKRSFGDRLLVMADPIFSPEDNRVKDVEGARVREQTAHLPTELMSIAKEIGLEFPRLPLTSTLAKSLATMYGPRSDLFLGDKASKQVLLEKPLGDYRSIVFATHGYFGNDIPGIQEPILALSLPESGSVREGFLRLSEVIGLKLNADVVALTACQTGLGRHLAGEGTMGLGRAFQYAGSRSVLMSLWSVAESSSIMLVERFFKHRKEGKSRLEALDVARKEIRAAGYEHPFFWSAFILVGETD